MPLPPTPLPDPDQLRAVLTAARDTGVAVLDLPGLLRVEFAPREGAPAPERIARAGDPLDIIRDAVRTGNVQPAQDMIDHLAMGGRFVQVGSGDPTAAG